MIYYFRCEAGHITPVASPAGVFIHQWLEVCDVAENKPGLLCGLTLH